MDVFFQPAVLTIVIVLFSLSRTETARAQEHESHGNNDAALHFSHPPVTESPSPDTKFRLDYILANEPGEEDEPDADRHTVRFEGEYAVAPWVSFVVNAPYTFLDPTEGENVNRFDVVELAIKYANFAFAKHGLLLGGGVSLPLTDDREFSAKPILSMFYHF